MHFCTEEFDLTDYSNSSCHNTNQNQNKGKSSYVEYDDYVKDRTLFPSHMSVREAFELIQRDRPEVDIQRDLWNPMIECMKHSMSAFRASVEVRAEEWLGQKLEREVNDTCWQLIGYDISFNNDLQPVFFEANSQTRQTIIKNTQTDPSVVQTSQFYTDMIPPMLSEMYKMMLDETNTGEWTLIYDSEDFHDLISEKALRLYKKLFTEHEHLSKICYSKFSQL